MKKILNKIFPVGTRSILFGAHAFWLHPWFVAFSWYKLFGFPWDIRLWFCFFLHDIGYLFSPNMDGPEGEEHPVIGAKIITFLFGKKWGDFCLYHSRYFCKKYNTTPSKLCYADKMAFVYTPKWIYIPMVSATGELKEYLQNAQNSDSPRWTPTNFDKDKWHSQLKEYFMAWVQEHKMGSEDTWTSKRHM